jgi:hypothetical protein
MCQYSCIKLALYNIVIRGLPVSTIIFYIISQKARFSAKSFASDICVLIFSTTFSWKISHSKKNSERYCYKCAQVSQLRTRYSCQILIETEFTLRIFEKYSNSWKSVQWEMNCPGRTDMPKLQVVFNNSKTTDYTTSLCLWPEGLRTSMTLSWCSGQRAGREVK